LEFAVAGKVIDSDRAEGQRVPFASGSKIRPVK